MALMREWVAVALLGLALFATGVRQARATDADPSVWGVYAHLVGTGWKGDFGTRATRWGAGKQMIEDDSSFGQSVITPGPTVGTLTLKLGSTGLHTFQGTIASDGSVLWVRDGMLKMPYRVLLRDGQLVEEAVKLSGREVASVKREMRYQQVDGPRSAFQRTPIPKPRPMSPAPVRNAPTANADIAPPKAIPSTPTSVFGPLGALNGQLFAGEVLSLKAQVTNGGQTLTLDQEGISTYVLNATDVPGTYSVPVHPNMSHDYHVEDSFMGHLLDDGAIEIRYRTRGVSGSKYATDLYRFEGNRIVIERYAENWGGRRMVGSPRIYVPATPELLQLAVANAISLTRAHEEGVIQNRRAEAERGAMFNSVLQGVAEGLAGGSTGGYAESQANLNATVANIQNAAAVERQQQAQAAPQSGALASRTVPELQPQPQPRPQTGLQPQPQPQPRDTTALETAAPAAAKQLRFVMSISLRNRPGDKVNPTCYSNIISRPGPPGWGASGFLPRGSAEQAREIVYGMKSNFIARCRASGREVTSEGSFNFQLNQMQGDEERLQGMRARHSEDVSVSL